MGPRRHKLTHSWVVGFTGSREGMTRAQYDEVWNKVDRLLFHAREVGSTSSGTTPQLEARVYGEHGDCVGSDKQFDQICFELGIPRGIRPCTLEHYRAHCEDDGAEVLAEPKPPMVRNRDIVTDSDILIATPNSFRVRCGSGTWKTIGFGEKAGIPVTIFFPDGTRQYIAPNYNKLARPGQELTQEELFKP